MAENKKPKTTSGTPAGTGKKSTAPDLAALIAAAQAAGVGTTSQKGPTFTSQDATAYVENIYRQLLGRSAAGAERAKAINIFLNQSRMTDVGGRQQAVVNFIESQPEYRKRQENTYLDAIYNAVAEDVRKAQG